MGLESFQRLGDHFILFAFGCKHVRLGDISGMDGLAGMPGIQSMTGSHDLVHHGKRHLPYLRRSPLARGDNV